MQRYVQCDAKRRKVSEVRIAEQEDTRRTAVQGARDRGGGPRISKAVILFARHKRKKAGRREGNPFGQIKSDGSDSFHGALFSYQTRQEEDHSADVVCPAAISKALHGEPSAPDRFSGAAFNR